MGLESATYLNDLVSTNPASSDGKSEGDDHLRLIKAVLQATFPGLAGRAWRRQAKSADYTATVTDNMTWLNFTATAILNLPAAATAGNGFFLIVRGDSGVVVTVDPNGAETVNGAATITLSNQAAALVLCTGSAWIAIVTQTSSATSLTDAGLVRPIVSSPREQYSAPGGVSGGVTVDMTGHAFFTLTLTGNITSLTINGVPSAGYCTVLTLVLTQGGAGSYTVSWPAAVKWPGGVAPTLTTTVGKADIISLLTYNGGTNWYGLVVGQNF